MFLFLHLQIIWFLAIVQCEASKYLNIFDILNPESNTHTFNHKDAEDFLARVSEIKSFSFNMNTIAINGKPPVKRIDGFTRFTFDLRNQLVKRSHHSTVGSEILSTTIYDFIRRRKYHYNTKSLCRQSVLPTGKNGNQILRLAAFERLEFSGNKEFAGRQMRIFEDRQAKELPGWLNPKVDIESMRTGTRRDNSSSVDILDQDLPNEHLGFRLIYYFDEGYLSTRLFKLDIEIYKKIDETDMKSILHLEYQIEDFDESSYEVDEFSLASLCSKSEDMKLSSKIVLLASSSVKNTKIEESDSISSLIRNSATRNELIMEMMNSEFDLNKVNLVHMRSQLIGLEQNKQVLPSMRIELTAAKLSIDSIRCSRLGRGRVIDENLIKLSVNSFDECFWLASNRHSDQSQVIFTFDKSFTCTISYLHREEVYEDSNTNSRGLNYELLRVGAEDLFTINKNDVTPADDSWINLLGKEFNLIGKRMTLKSSSSTSLNYELGHIDTSQHSTDLKSNDTSSIVRFISGVAWTNVNDGYHGHQVSINSVNEESPTFDWQISRSQCRSICLMDLQCKSYSYCESSWPLYSQPECVLSEFDVRQAVIYSGIRSALPNVVTPSVAAAGETHEFNIEVDSYQTNIRKLSFKKQRGCAIYAKHNMDSFKFDQQLKVDSKSLESRQTVDDPEECADICTNKNIEYVKDLLTHQKAMINWRTTIRNELEYDEFLVHFDWRRQHINNLCTRFLYFEKKVNSIDSGFCVLPESSGLSSSGVSHETLHSSTSDHKSNQLETVSQYRLKIANLYQRIIGVKLNAISHEDFNVNIDTHDYAVISRMLKSHLSGENQQVKLPIDDVEQCARACILQLHGPRPSCSSFGMVLESGRRYCLLNSQSLYDLTRLNLMDSWTSDSKNGSIYWHFEPQESLLKRLDLSSSKENQIFEIDVSSSNFKSLVISSILFVISSLLGIYMGFSSAAWVKRNASVQSELDKEGNKMCRLVHRLSGVSLGPAIRESDVVM